MTGIGKARVGLPALAVAALAVLAFASPALALKPTGPFANFGDCPQGVTGVNLCVYATTSSGQFTIKKTTVPIEKPITLQGGIILNEATGTETWVNAADGNTVSKSPQTVPGGLFKILAPEFFPEPLKKIFNEFINKGITGATATTELVGTIQISRGALITQSGNALVLPLRVHLENPFLGPSCYVGSKANPVVVELTTGTTPNKELTGALGELEFPAEGLLVIKKNKLVNSTFSTPGAEGCGSQILFGLFTGLIDEAVDHQLEVPSTSGNNKAILEGTLENAEVTAVKASEK